MRILPKRGDGGSGRPRRDFDDVYIVSDLHLGGTGSNQLFEGGALFPRLVETILRHPPGRRVALVVNGDLVDFLAEPGARYLDPDGAIDKLDRIAADPSFVPVWNGLREVARRPNTVLAVTLGNHDLELALPWVWERFVDLIAGVDDLARSRIEPALDGTGFLCSVSGRSILCIHGNDVDPWNVTDYEALRRIARDATQGRDVSEWSPNAGTRLVIDVMNEVKRKFPFVDLLKPETRAVVPVLLALDPSQISKVRRAFPVIARRSWDAIRIARGLLDGSDRESGTPSSGGSPTDGDPVDQLLRETFSVVRVGEGAARSSMLEAAEARLLQGERPIHALAARRGELLGVRPAIWNAVRGRPMPEVLREALEGLHNDRTSDVTAEDDTFRALDATIGPEVDLLVSGHTHNERILRRKRGSGYYLNAGSWIPRVRFTPGMLSSDYAFAEAMSALASGDRAKLGDVEGLKENQATVAVISSQGSSVSANLMRVVPGQAQPALVAIDPGAEVMR